MAPVFGGLTLAIWFLLTILCASILYNKSLNEQFLNKICQILLIQGLTELAAAARAFLSWTIPSALFLVDKGSAPAMLFALLMVWIFFAGKFWN